MSTILKKLNFTLPNSERVVYPINSVEIDPAHTEVALPA
jgi:hypothetical protein